MTTGSYSNYQQSKIFAFFRKFWPLIFLTFYLLAIVQNFLFSYLKNTGFYLSESALYNVFWLLFIPILIFQQRKKKSDGSKIPYRLLYTILSTALHILIFSGLFFLVSWLFFNPHHRFMTMLKSVTANYLFLTLIIYFFVPMIFEKKTLAYKPARKFLPVKRNGTTIMIELSQLEYITTERPYLALYGPQGKHLVTSSIKEFSKELDPILFRRVHRSTLANLEKVKSLKSRHNGDYDAELESGASIRLSRHYREHWMHLLD